ncbi:hypothetical protein [Apilactobacillus quenuiae]|uniref:hypothetical protein n=1 Tax=Apilactobacillus quenuiae TaxID=2008377 RepID=UPI000D01CE56|nr:hypothetical protein [Apilactobacillus quenuiae]
MKRVKTLVIIVLLCSLGMNVYQGKDFSHIQQQKHRIKMQQVMATSQLKQIKNDNENIKHQLARQKIQLNNKGKSVNELNFNNKIRRFINVMNTFDPNTYRYRKNAVRNLISPKLYKQYFDHKLTYGDSNEVSSRLKRLNLYTQSKQGTKMKGLAVVNAESKSNHNPWEKNTFIYQITFNTATNKIEFVQNLGSSFKASDVQ